MTKLTPQEKMMLAALIEHHDKGTTPDGVIDDIRARIPAMMHGFVKRAVRDGIKLKVRLEAPHVDIEWLDSVEKKILDSL